MKLIRLSVASIIACVVGLLILIAATVASFERMRQAQAEIATLFALHERVDSFSAASDSLLLHGADAELWAAYRAQARALQDDLRDLADSHSGARRASHLVDVLLETLRTATRPRDPSAQGADLGPAAGRFQVAEHGRVLMGQVAGHGVALETAIESLLHERQQELTRTVTWSRGAFAATALLFGIACAFAFLLIHRRLSGPIRSLSDTIRRIGRGETHARANVTGDDELAELATAFNGLADQRQQAMTDVEHNERMLAESQRIAQVGSWRLDLATMGLEWSAETYRIVGVDPATFTPTIERYLEHVHPDDRGQVAGERDRALRGECPGDIDFRIMRADGTVRHVRQRAEIEHDDGGNALGITGTLQDVSDQKAAEHEITRLARRLSTTLESVTDAFFTLDADWRFTYVNAEAARLLRCSVEGLLGTSVWTEFPGAVGTTIEREYRRAVADNVPVALEEYYSPLETWFDIRAYPSEEGLAVFFRDVTERHAFLEQLEVQERDLRQSRDELAYALETRQTLVNALPAHIALLDGTGEILDVNEQWRQFGQANGLSDATSGVGSNYLSVCEAAIGPEVDEAATQARNGLGAVLSGAQQRYALEYPCHSPDQPRWFRMMANRLDAGVATEEHGAVVMHIDVTERKLAEQELDRLAYEDALTGTPSRNGFVRAVAGRIDAAGWQAHAVVVVLDVRQLRDINDAHGYAAGDEILQQIARRLQERAGSGAVVGRIGGDEFAVFLPAQADHRPAERRTAIDNAFAEPFHLGQLPVESGATYGYTLLGAEPREIEDLLREAELALFQSRRGNGAQPWVAYTSVLRDEARQRMRITSELRHALENDEFQLHFQPKVDIRDGSLIGSEALLRWMHPEHGLLSPGAFIPTAERSQLIGPIGEWAINEACRCLSQWQADGLEIVRVAVNVSLIQFTVGDLTEIVRRALETHGVAPGGLTLEITESVFERESDVLLRQLRALHEMGVRLSLDDFGTGYSSLLYLQKYPFDEIKIDRGFVNRMLDNDYSRNIVGTVLGIAGGLGAESVAEGVETPAVRDALLAMGCRYAQGFCFSVPLEAEDFRWLLEMRSTLPLPRQQRSR